MTAPAPGVVKYQKNQSGGRGGKRPNSGRPPGALNKSNEEARRKAAETGETPLEYMLRVMRDADVDDDRRDDMAKAAAPYVHSKLANMQVTGADGGPLTVEIVRLSDVAHSTT